MKILKTIIRRVVISAIREGAIQRFDADGIVPGEFSDREMFQQYGFSSGKAGMEGVVLGIGNVFYLIASDDRRYRIAREDGETVIYTDEGDKVHLKRERIMELLAGAKIVLNSPIIELGDGTLRRLIDERMVTAHNQHVHGVAGTPPTTQIVLNDVATVKTKAS